MATLIHIAEPDPAPAPRPEWRAFLSLGFRPLYIAGTAWAAVAVALWIFAPHWLQGPLSGVAWHAHEMLWGFVATIAVGFLMTAGANWTGINPLHGKTLAAACVLWLTARAGFLAGGATGFWIAAAAETAFFLVAAVAMARVVIASRNQRNYAVPLLLAGLGASDGAFLLAIVQGGDYALLMQRLQAGLLCMALVALLVARRVIPFFAMRAVPGLLIPLHQRSGQVQLGAGVVAIVALLAGLAWVQAAALFAAGAIALWQVGAWRPLAVRTRPLLWILYLGYAGIGLGLLTSAVQAAGLPLRSAVPVHLVAMAGFSVLIIGMVTRTALGHLGRGLKLDRSMVASYGLVLAAVALRLSALWPSAIALHLLHLSATAWIAAFGLYLWRFVPWLVRPRPDA
jgi:uncharacterized protein involved in response to NO